LDLAKDLQPRSITVLVRGDGLVFTGGMDRFVGTPVLIQNIPDWEAAKLAAELFNVLSRFGWKPVSVDEAATTVSPLAIDDGVNIFTAKNVLVLKPGTKRPSTAIQRRLSQAAEVLGQYLQAFSIEYGHSAFRDNEANVTRRPFAPSYLPPENTLVVLIGANPTWWKARLANSTADTNELLHLQRDGPRPFGW